MSQNSRFYCGQRAGGDGVDPFAATEEEKPKQEVPQVSSPQPASPTGRVVRDRQKLRTVVCRRTVFQIACL